MKNSFKTKKETINYLKDRVNETKNTLLFTPTVLKNIQRNLKATKSGRYTYSSLDKAVQKTFKETFLKKAKTFDVKKRWDAFDYELVDYNNEDKNKKYKVRRTYLGHRLDNKMLSNNTRNILKKDIYKSELYQEKIKGVNTFLKKLINKNAGYLNNEQIRFKIGEETYSLKSLVKRQNNYEKFIANLSTQDIANLNKNIEFFNKRKHIELHDEKQDKDNLFDFSNLMGIIEDYNETNSSFFIKERERYSDWENNVGINVEDISMYGFNMKITVASTRINNVSFSVDLEQWNNYIQSGRWKIQNFLSEVRSSYLEEFIFRTDWYDNSVFKTYDDKQNWINFFLKYRAVFENDYAFKGEVKNNPFLKENKKE